MQHFPKHKTKKQCKLKSNNNILKGLDYSKTYLTEFVEPIIDIQ